MSAFPSNPPLRLGTKLIHVGSEPDPQTGAVVPPISLATTFAQPSPGSHLGHNDPNSHGMGYDYARTSNPTRGAFERAVAAAESAEHAVAFSSGCAAINASVHLLTPGARITSVDDVYGGTQRIFSMITQPLHSISVEYVDFSSPTKHTFASSSMIWLETPTNPTLKVTDISLIASLKPATSLLVVDNTFATPYFQNPLSLGADIVVHSVTKYINGHSDVVMGVCLTNDKAVYEKLRFHQNAAGAIPSPFDCYLALRGLKTLHVRMAAAASNAMAVATFLESHSLVDKVLYPGLVSHPQHKLAATQMSGPGAMVTFYVKGGVAEARTFLSSLKVFALAESLGAVESLAESPAIMTHQNVPVERRKELGIDDRMVRLSVGLEGVDDLIADLDYALQQSK